MKKLLSVLVVTVYLSPLAAFAQSPFGDPITDPGSATGVGQVQGTGSAQGIGTTTTPNANQPATGLNAGNATQATGNGLLPSGTSSGNGNTVGSVQNVGNYVNAGGGQNVSFWDYFWGQITNSGSLNQSTFKNQDTKVEYTQTGAADITQGPLSTSYVTPTSTKVSSPTKTSTFSCSTAGTKSLGQYFKTANCIMYLLIPIVIAMMLLWFFFGAFKYASSNGEEARTEYKTYLIWAVVIIFVALSFVGILRLLSKTTGL